MTGVRITAPLAARLRPERSHGLIALRHKFGDATMIPEGGELERFDTLFAAGLVRSGRREGFGVFVILEGLLSASFELFFGRLSGAVDDRDTAIVQRGERCEVLLN